MENAAPISRTAAQVTANPRAKSLSIRRRVGGETSMSLVRYEPWDVLNQLHREIKRVFDTQSAVNGAADSSATADWIPPADIAEYKDRWVLKFDVPGVNTSAIDITLE